MICSAITRSGQRCKGVAIDATGLCYAHHPDHAEDRRRAARKGGHRGGRGRPNADTAELKGLLSDLYAQVLDESVKPNVAAVAAQIANARIRLVETERKLWESDELRRELEELRALLEGEEQGRRWG